MTLIESTVVVTCATGEIGKAIATSLAKKNNLILVGRNREKLEGLQAELTRQFAKQYSICQLDYADPVAPKIMEEKVQNREINGFVVITPRPQIELLADPAKWQEVLGSCFTGPSSVMKAALPRMAKNSKITVISGITSVQLSPGYTGPSVIRGLWRAFAKALSFELGPKDIRVNTVSPGTVLTEHHISRITKKAEENSRSFEEQLKVEVSETPLKRYATVKDVAQAMKFFLSDKSSHISGTNLLVDGGITRAVL